MYKLLLLLSFLCYTFGQDETVTPLDPSQTKTFRAFAVTTTSNSITVAGAASTRSSSGNFNFEANVDAAAFKFQTGPGQDLGYYYGGASIDVKVSWDGTSGLATVSGAGCEVVFGVSTFCVFEEHDGNAGFNYNVGDDLVCPGDGTKDCLVGGTCTDTKDMSWTVISVATEACPSNQGYDTTCQVYTITSTGTWTCPIAQCGLSQPQYQVFTAVTKLANQQVQLGNHQIGPYNGKTTWDYKYPWAAPTNAPINVNNSRIVAVTYVAGKAGSIQSTTVWNDDGKSWSSNGKTTFLSYAKTATVDNSDTSVYYVGIDDDVIINSPNSNDPVTLIIITVWKTLLSVWKAFGWKCQVMFFSWNENHPAHIIYDPAFGQTDVGTSSSAADLAPGLMLPLFICIAQYFYRKF